MNQTRTVEEYEKPDISCFKTQTRQMLCESFGNVDPTYNGFKEEEL